MFVYCHMFQYCNNILNANEYSSIPNLYYNCESKISVFLLNGRFPESDISALCRTAGST